MMNTPRHWAGRLAVVCLLLLGQLCLAAPTSAPQHFFHGTQKFIRDVTSYRLDNANVYVIPIRDEIRNDMAFRFHRLVLKARAGKADAIVLDIHTLGGSVDSMKQMLDEILAFQCPVYSYVNNDAISAGAVLALGGDVIVMGPSGKIGAAYPITGTGQPVGEGNKRVEEKFLSYMRGMLRSTALSRGHDPDLAQRMTDPSYPLKKYPALVREDELLTLTYDQATSLGLAAYQADNVNDLLEKAGFKNPQIITPSLTWSEALAGVTVNPVVSGLLMLIALAAFYLEFKMTGSFVPASIGILALALFFWGKMLADLASYIEVVVFILGVVLLLLEIFVIPGFGLAGIAGIAFILGSLLFSMINLPSSRWDAVNMDAMKVPLFVMSSAVLLAVPMFIAITRYLPSVPMFRSLATDPARTPAALQEEALRGAPPKYLGKSGRALSDLRPSGIAEIGVERVPVVTRGEYIEQGTPIKVIAERGNEIIVAQDESPRF